MGIPHHCRLGRWGESQRVLASKLRDLERDGYVVRKVYRQPPLRVEYALKEMAESAIAPITALMKLATRGAATKRS